MNLLLRELNINKKGLILWGIIIIALVSSVMFLYPSMADDAANMMDMVNGMPEGVRAFYNSAFGLDRLSITDIFGFYAMYVGLFVMLLGSIYAIMLSAGLLSKEEGEKTIEFLLAKPLTRREIVTSKLLSYLFNVFILNLVLGLAVFAVFQIIKREPFSITTFLLIIVAPFLLHLTFASIGFLLSTFITKSKTVLSASLGIVFLTYFCGIISGMTESMGWLKWLSPFKYVEPADIIPTGRIDLIYLILILIINVFCIGLTYYFYERKDITV